MRATVSDANDLAAKANKALRRCDELEEALKAAEKRSASRWAIDEAQDIAEEEEKAGLREKFEDLASHTNVVEVNLTECKKHLEESEEQLREALVWQLEWKQAAGILSQVLVDANHRQPDIAHKYGIIW